MDPVFLTLDEALTLHTDQIERYGGSRGIQDRDLLSFALGTPAATFRGSFLHQSPFEMAAAYLFHVAQNHPFVDGNKRTALAASLVFLAMNEVEVRFNEDELTELALGVADGRITKAEVAVFLQKHAARRRQRGKK